MEGRWCFKSLLLQLVLIIATARLSQCTLQSEIDANTQTVKFDEIYDAKDWKSQDAFITAMTTAVNDYCSNTTNMASCQLTSFDSNSTFMVVAVGEGGFTYINGDIQVDFYVRFPDSGVDTSGPNEFVLEKSVVTTITELNENAINSATNQTLVFIGNTRLYPIDNSVNVIMIPVAIVILVLVILLAVVLQCIQSRGEKKHQQRLINKPEEGSSKKGEEAITLTAVKRPGYDGAAADSSEPGEKPTKKFRRVKKLKTREDGSTIQVNPEIHDSKTTNRSMSPPPRGIQVQPAPPYTFEDNFSTNNSNDMMKSHEDTFSKQRSRHGIELPPLTDVSATRRLSDRIDSSDSDNKSVKSTRSKKKKRRSKRGLVDAEQLPGERPPSP